jgi:hypothetical protein
MAGLKRRRAFGFGWALRRRFVQERGGEQFQPASGSGREGLGQPRRGGLAEFRFSLLVRLDKQMSTGR